MSEHLNEIWLNLNSRNQQTWQLYEQTLLSRPFYFQQSALKPI